MTSPFRRKSWDKLAADAHQANSQGDLIEALRRLTSSASRLTWVIIFLTFVILVLTAVMAVPSFRDFIRDIFNFYFPTK